MKSNTHFFLSGLCKFITLNVLKQPAKLVTRKQYIKLYNRMHQMLMKYYTNHFFLSSNELSFAIQDGKQKKQCTLFCMCITKQTNQHEHKKTKHHDCEHLLLLVVVEQNVAQNEMVFRMCVKWYGIWAFCVKVTQFQINKMMNHF